MDTDTAAGYSELGVGYSMEGWGERLQGPEDTLGGDGRACHPDGGDGLTVSAQVSTWDVLERQCTALTHRLHLNRAVFEKLNGK